MTIHLGCTLPHTSCNQPGPRRENAPAAPAPKAQARRAAPIRSCSRWGLPCHACYQARGALLPHPFTLTRLPRKARRAVCFLWHFPWGRPRRALPGTVFPWSPDFPLPCPKTSTAAIRPASRDTETDVDRHGQGASAPERAVKGHPSRRRGSAFRVKSKLLNPLEKLTLTTSSRPGVATVWGIR